MHESPLKVEVPHSDSFENDGRCDNPNFSWLVMTCQSKGFASTMRLVMKYSPSTWSSFKRVLVGTYPRSLSIYSHATGPCYFSAVTGYHLANINDSRFNLIRW
jgi:hypothetical protein